MEIFFTILILILTVSISGFITKIDIFRKIPLPIIQIGTGALLAWPHFGLHIDFDPELFLVLLIPPLLFVDGWKTSTKEFFNNGREIFILVLGLVFVTILGIGFVIYFLLHKIPLIIAFSLAAVLSPTDVVVLSSILRKDRIPKKMMSILEGEALINDASGLVALKFIIAIAMGEMIFSISGIIIDFLKILIGSSLIGVVVMLLYSKSLYVTTKLRATGDDSVIHMILMLLLPFASYLIAEHIGFSGILSSVSAGMTISKFGLIRNAPLSMRLKSDNIWSMLEFVFNGLVFMMLGLQLPGIWKTSISQVRLDPDVEIWILFFSVFVVYLSLLFLRFFWLWLMKHFSKIFLKKNPLQFFYYNTRELWLISFAGVRGTITLAGVLSIPLFLSTGIPFPLRYQLIFIAAGVIILSIISGVLILPIILDKFHIGNKQTNFDEIRMARTAMAEVAIVSLKKMEERLSMDSKELLEPEVIREVSAQVTAYLRRRTATKDEIERNLLIENLECRFRLTALRSERAELYHLRATRKISNETMHILLSELDLMETLLTDKKC